ncbi:MAG: M28 family metallopeptidase [Thermoplasmatota archaeon]
MRVLPAAVAASFLVLTVAGCLDDGAAPSAEAPAGTFAQRLAADAATTEWDADAGMAWWADFATTYTMRNVGLPGNQAATDHIADSLRGFGMDVTVLEYPACTPLIGQPCAPAPAGPAKVHVVMGLKLGTTDPGHAIALGAHYDNVYPGLGLTEGTREAAYDNGSGTAMVFNVCRELAKAEMARSLVCLFFDGEELGILGSRNFVANPPEGAPEIDLYLGYDMVGLNWPGYTDWKLYNWVADEFAADLHPFVNATVTEVLGWPAAGAEVFPFNDRNSDEAAFIAAHIPAVRFAGGRRAGDYPQYHKLDDTVAFVDQFAGGRDQFTAGFGAIVEESVLLARMFDQTSLPEIQAEYT